MSDPTLDVQLRARLLTNPEILYTRSRTLTTTYYNQTIDGPVDLEFQTASRPYSRFRAAWLSGQEEIDLLILDFRTPPQRLLLRAGDEVLLTGLLEDAASPHPKLILNNTVGEIRRQRLAIRELE